MAGEYVFNLQGLSKFHDHVQVLDTIHLAFFFGAKIGVIGGNGAGKSSLLKIMAGLDRDYMGEMIVAPRTQVGYLAQEPLLDPEHTVQEAVQMGVAESQALIDRYDEICDALGDDLSDAEQAKLNDELGRLQDLIDHRNLWELDHQVEVAMDALRLPPADMKVGPLSGGEKRRVAICALLLSNPDVLLLDEPTNHLDAESVAWLEAYLKRFEGTLVVVTHDRYFLQNVTEWILEMDGGKGYPYKGNYESWLEQKQASTERMAKVQASRRKLLEQELMWVRMNAGARHSRNQARIKRYEELAAQTVDTREESMTIQIPSSGRLGDLVVRAENLTKVYDERILMEQVHFDLPRGGIVGVIGPNGAGKTTLVRMIVGQEGPTSGALTVGPTVQIAYVDQSRDSLRNDRTVYEEITDGGETVDLGGRAMNGRAYCGRFNFKGSDQQKMVGELSGGERNRVHLAKLLRSGGNLLILDEPTNDLDVTTLRSLEEGLTSYGGCAIVISHDRWFLDRVATHILAFEGDSRVTWFEGNFDAYHQHRRKLLGDEADRPHRITYRSLKL